jgi:hypothetical protein
VRFLDKEELGEWLTYPQTKYYLHLLEKEVLTSRENYDIIEREGEGRFKKQQGIIEGLKKARSIAINIQNTED